MGPPTPRTTAALVEGIIDVQAGTDLTPFIASGNMLCTALCTYPAVAPITIRGNRRVPDPSPVPTPYTDGFIGSQMELIERWLSAHFYAVYDTQLTYTKAGAAAAGFQYKIDYGLKSTKWGQTAIMLDYLGNLAAWDNTSQTRRRITLRVESLGDRRCRWFWNYGYDGFPCADLTIVQ
jgi:hypothetical protein